MKRITALILALVMGVSIFAFTSCGSKNDTVENLEAEYSREFEGTTLG